jgi:hypothetical protein
MPQPLSSSATMSMYGDSISDFLTFATFNQALYRELGGRIRLAENDPLVQNGEVWNHRPGWDVAVAGTTVTAITHRFLAEIPFDEASVVFVLMGANGYGPEGPGIVTDKDWIDRAKEIVAAAAAYNKILVFIPPISHELDPKSGRDALKAFLPTIASPTVIVPDVSAFDWHVDTNDGVHPNLKGSTYLARQAVAALGANLGPAYDFAPVSDPSVNLVKNGDLAGIGGTLAGAGLGQTAGVVADGWTLKRIGTAGTAIGAKGLDGQGNAAQILTYDGKGQAVLTQAIKLNGRIGEQYEIALHVKVTDPNGKFQGIRAWDTAAADGLLFAGTATPLLANGGTGSYETVLRSGKLTLTSNQLTATINIAASFDTASGATVEIDDVIVRRVAGTPVTSGVATPGTGTISSDVLRATNSGMTLNGLGGNDTLYGGTGNDTLNGGTGVDVMFGGAGNDTYIVENPGDKVFETATQLATDKVNLGGIDTVRSAISYSIAGSFPGRQFIENLTLTAASATNATGNDLANVLTGNSAANILDGGNGNDQLFGGAGRDRLIGGTGNNLLVGGSGADVLTGGGGTDTFRFNFLDAAGIIDTLTDFTRVADRLAFDRAAFAGFAGDSAGALNPLALAFGTVATTAAHHLIYNPNKGALYYDADGVGGTGAVLIAMLTGHPVLTANDIVLI